MGFLRVCEEKVVGKIREFRWVQEMSFSFECLEEGKTGGRRRESSLALPTLLTNFLNSSAMVRADRIREAPSVMCRDSSQDPKAGCSVNLRHKVAFQAGITYASLLSCWLRRQLPDLRCCLLCQLPSSSFPARSHCGCPY